MNQELMQKALCGDPEAQYIVGDAYYNGTSVTQSYEKAYQWYSRSAEQGNAWGQFNMGKCYLYGHGVAMSDSKARHWFGCCAAQNNEWGQKYSHFCNVHEHIMKKAMEGDSEAQYQYGDAFFRGKELGPLYDNAFLWYRRSAEQDHEWGLFNVGKCYLYGQGVQESLTNAQQWFERSAARGNEWGEKYAKFCHQWQTSHPWKALLFAVSIGETELFSHFIGRIEKKSDYLYSAASRGDSVCVRLLLEAGYDANDHPTYSASEGVLKYAARNGHVECVRLLLDYGAYIDYKGLVTDIIPFDGRPALAEACAGGHLECVRLLLDRGANVNNTYGGQAFGPKSTALCAAVNAGSEDCVRLLLERGASTKYVKEPIVSYSTPGSCPPRFCPQEVWEESCKRWNCLKIVKAHEQANKGILGHMADAIKNIFS